MPRSALVRAIEALVFVALAAVLAHRAATPPSVVPATSPDTSFSAERAMRHVRAIAQRPRPSGSVEHARAREYLVGELRANGFEVHVQEAVAIGTRYRMAGTVRNVVARLHGRAPGKRAVLLVSHYDSQGASPGAGDAASATAALLETARALRTGPPLANDVIVLLTDAEETGLLGAAAFARDHPWARDVDVILNFEARGTEGRVFMFETDEGNLDGARVLRGVPDVSSTSLMVLVYRLLPNDTDLSELTVLGRPAMNFAFIDGVERYHTARDDIAHLDPRSVQHHGMQALALARAFGDGPLPRPRTGDAVFFDVPLLGLVVYPDGWAWVFAALALVLATAVAVRARWTTVRPARDVALGAVGALFGAVIAAVGALALALLITAMHSRFGWGGAPEWRGIYAAAVVAVSVAVATGTWMLARRWGSAAGLHAGAIVMHALLAVVTTLLARGASYLFVWPAVFVAGSSLAISFTRSPVPRLALQWIGMAVVLTMLAPLIYLLGVALGIQLPGAAAMGLFAGLGAWLVAPWLERLVTAGGEASAPDTPWREPSRWTVPVVAAGIALTTVAVGAATVRPSSRYPTRASVRHEVAIPDGAMDRPHAVVERDSTDAGVRTVTLRITPPDSTWILQMPARSIVRSAMLDGQALDTSRYRRSAATWALGYVAPPDTGIVLRLSAAAGAPLDLELLAERPGLPDSLARTITRGAEAAPAHHGDVTVIRRHVRVP